MEGIVMLIFFCICYSLLDGSKSNNDTSNKSSNSNVSKNYTSSEGYSNNRTNIERTSIDKSENNYDYNHFHTKVVGVTVGKRQEYIKNLHNGETLILNREPNNTYDKNAIVVMNEDGNIIGYIKKKIAYYMAEQMDDYDDLYYCRVENITGGGDYNYGVNIKIDKYDIKVHCYHCRTLCCVPFRNRVFCCPNCNSSLFETNESSLYETNETLVYTKPKNKSYYNDNSYNIFNNYFDIGDNDENHNDYDDNYTSNYDCDADPDMCCGYDH